MIKTSHLQGQTVKMLLKIQNIKQNELNLLQKGAEKTQSINYLQSF